MKSLAIFQYDWPLQVHTTHLAEMFAASGVEVDLYLCGCDARFVDLERLMHHPGVRVLRYEPTLIERIHDRLSGWLRPQGHASSQRLLKRSVVDGAVRHFAGRTYDYLIGIEKKGLLWASELARLTDVPVIYYSLELYIEDHPAIAAGGRTLARLREVERKSHLGVSATIIQDPCRAETLAQANLLGQMTWVYFPVSVAGPAEPTRSNYLQRLLDLPDTKKLLLGFGDICPERASDLLALCSYALPKVYVMVLHGRGLPADLDRLREHVDRDRFLLSHEMVDEKDIFSLVASAHIGLALYPRGYSNDELTAFSSEKIALYCRAGIPFVAFNNRSYQRLFEQYECGVLIESVDELVPAIQTIENEYDVLSRNALKAFDRYYCAENNFAALKAFLDGAR